MAKNKSWRKIYIKILTSGPDESEYLYASELIDNGYAKGKVLWNHTGIGNPISKIQWEGVTTSGREYIDDLQQKISRQTLRYKIVAGSVVCVSWVAGVLSQIAAQWVACP